MTDLEKKCVNALRLSDASAEALLTEIQDNISVARAELVRLGFTEDESEDETDTLVCNVIVKYVVSEMASIESERDKAYETFRICIDELRKSDV